MNQRLFEGKNLYIENKKAERFYDVVMENGIIYVDGKEKIVSRDIYACLSCKRLKNVTWIMKGTESYTVSFIFEKKDDYEKFLEMIQKEFPMLRLSRQNQKITGYAAAITAKLREGIETEIIDTEEETKILCCPVCGMQCDPNIPYCMECGASVS